MDYKKESAKNANRSGTWIKVIGILGVLLSILTFVVGLTTVPESNRGIFSIAGISGFISSIVTIGIGNALACLADILETNYRTYQILSDNNETNNQN